MAEKRFNVFDVDGTVFIEDHKEGSYHIGEKENVDIPCLNDIADRLNTYADENEDLKQSLSSTVRELQYGVKKVQKLAKENKQLKQFKEKVFVLLDEKIKHYEHKPFSAPVGQPMSVNFDVDMDRLARLSELQQLKEELKVMWND